MKGLCRRALAALLVVALLVGAGGSHPASAGSLAIYPPGDAKYTNADGWSLLSFEANGPSKHSILGWVDSPLVVLLESFWERGGEIVKHDYSGQVTVAPGTFKWKIEDESIAQIITAGGG